MQISEEELKKNVSKMERGTPVINRNQVLCVVDLKDGNQTTNYFSLEELASLLTQRAADACPECGDTRSPIIDVSEDRVCRVCGTRR